MGSHRIDLSDMPRGRFRSLNYHGKNSMTDMNLMMVGNTPLYIAKPKIVREEIAYTNGDLDLSRIDGEMFFERKTMTYSFVAMTEYETDPTGRSKAISNPLVKNRVSSSLVNSVTSWLYNEWVGGDITQEDMIDDAPTPTQVVGHYSSTEMHDTAYGVYKFTNVAVDDIQVSKAMFNQTWVEQVTITFSADPYLQSIDGEKVDISTFVDRTINSRNIQTALYIYRNFGPMTVFNYHTNAFWLNDMSQWFNDGLMLNDGYNWRFRIKIPYSEKIGIWLSDSPIFNNVQYPITSASGINFLDNDNPDQVMLSKAGGYGFVTPTYNAYTGYYEIVLDITFEDEWSAENKPYIHIEWGVLRYYDTSDQQHYYLDAYTKHNTATFFLNAVQKPFSTAFALEYGTGTRMINELHVRNENYDGLYKLRSDTTTRRL